MKVVQCNVVCGQGSTGRICVGISKVMNEANIENYILYTVGNSNYSQAIKCTEPFPKFQALKSRIKGNYGFNSEKTTLNLIKEFDRLQPDVVLLHNMHGHNCDLEILTDYFRKQNTKLLWTFHDCWTFTAYCPHYTMEKCYKWKTGCYDCTQYRKFSWFKDNSVELYERKKRVFSGLDMTIITPSYWLKDQVKQSFLKDYPIEVIHNGVNIDVFRPRASSFREKYGISSEKFVILGVAIQWVPRKGADVFVRLSKKIDPNKFQIVLVGTDDSVDKHLPENIISIHRTANQQELAEIYTAADLFVNPTREEVFGLVNVEANACGTPVLTYRTGGSPECIDDTSGSVVDCDDENALYSEILRIESEKPFIKENCRKRAEMFSERLKYMEYVRMITKSIE